jgi:hypothetical protein
MQHDRDEKCTQNFSRKPEGKMPFGRVRRRCEINVKINFKRIGYWGLDSSDLHRDQFFAVLTTILNVLLPTREVREFLDQQSYC